MYGTYLINVYFCTKSRNHGRIDDTELRSYQRSKNHIRGFEFSYRSSSQWEESVFRTSEAHYRQATYHFHLKEL